jgi:cysteine desulfurase/selenocysteine lyase
VIERPRTGTVAAPRTRTLDPRALKARFPIFQALHRPPLVYLDSAATSQKPDVVLEAMNRHYARHNANIHRGIYRIAEEATKAYENVRRRAAEFIGAASPREIVFTRNSTEGINLVAHSWGRSKLQRGDAILLTEMEHHSNLVPWQMLAAERDIELRFIPVTPDGLLDLDRLPGLLADGRVKLVGVVHISNVLGTINPIEEIARQASAAGAKLLVDASQSVPHRPVDVRALGADFLVFTGHKMLGPTGVGVLWARRALLEEMPPFLGGGEMIRDVRLDGFTTNDVPWKFEAGTMPIAEAVGFGAAVDYMTALGMPAVRDHEMRLTRYTLDALRDRFPDTLTIYGPLDTSVRGGAVSFLFDGIHAHDISQVLDEDAVCVRAGHHCAKPLMRQLGVPATTRASVYVYNDEADIDVLVESLAKAQKFFIS